MKKWQVTISEPAEADLDEIYTYITETLLEPVTAWHQIARIREAVLGLDEMPERGSLLPDEPWRSRGLRRLLVDNYTIIYEIQETADTVVVIAILYSRRNLNEALSQEENQW